MLRALVHVSPRSEDQILLVADKGQLIRCPVEDIRIAGRSTQGVIVFDTRRGNAVSVEHMETAKTGMATATRPSPSAHQSAGAVLGHSFLNQSWISA